MPLTRRDFLSISAASVFAPPRRKTNFLVILADDMGFSDARCYGGDIDTPNLDRLAANGLRFTQGYSTARCGPSRSCLLTGQYAQQTACDVMTPGNIPAWTRYASQHLKPLGYRAYHSGKWHIRFRPKATAGFDHSYNVQNQNNFFNPKIHILDDQTLPLPKPDDGYYATTAITDHALRFLEEHQNRHSSEPFYFYLAYTSPHFPLHALQQDIDRYKDRFAEGWDVARQRRHQRLKQMGLVNCGLAPLEPGIWPPWNTKPEDQLTGFGPGEIHNAVPWATLTPDQKAFQRTKMAIHAAMITRMDTEIGRVIDQIRRMNALEDTLILFLSDNGASAEIMIRGDGHDRNAPAGSGQTHLCLGPGWSSAANAPFRLHKSWVHEGGIASPWIAHWPNGISEKGKLRHNPCHFVDVLPTLIDLAGGDPAKAMPAEVPPLAGRSIAPAFRKDYTVAHDFLYFHHNNNRALRQGDWKIVAAGAQGPWELYNLSTDRCEQKNLASAEPQRLQSMAALWKKTDANFVDTRQAAVPTQEEPLRNRP